MTANPLPGGRDGQRSETMKLNHETLDGGIYRIALDGPLDMAGAAMIDPHFAMVTEKERRLIVDLSGVDFLASIGIRVLVMAARGIAERGGRMAVYGAQEAPARVLKSTGVDQIVKLVDDEAAAIAWVSR